MRTCNIFVENNSFTIISTLPEISSQLRAKTVTGVLSLYNGIVMMLLEIKIIAYSAPIGSVCAGCR
jgi:hypothetical protein